MNKIDLKKIILIVALLSVLLSIFSTLKFAYKNRDFLFNDSGGNGVTIIQARINTDFDKRDIEKSVRIFTHQKQDRIDVELNPTNSSEIIIKMDYLEPNEVEDLTNQLQQKYSPSVKILKIQSIRNSNGSASRRKIYIILTIEYIITIILLCVGFIILKKK